MKKLLILILCSNSLVLAQAQSAGDYQTIASGNWSSSLIWQRFDGSSWQSAIAAPSSSDGAIHIRNSHSVAANTTISADELTIDAGGTLTISNVFTLLDGVGTDLLCNGTLNLSNTITGAGSGTVNNIMNWTGGNLSSPFSISAAASLNLLTGTKTLASVLTNNGTVNWSSANINLATGTFINAGVINNSFDGTLFNFSGTNLFTNTGSFNKTGGSAVNTTIAIPMSNSGTISVTSGTFIKSTTNLTNSGTINIASGCTFYNTATTDLNTGTIVTGSGTLVMDGTININDAVSPPSSITINKPNGGTTAGSGIFTVNGTMNWTNGTIGSPFTIAAGATLSISSSNKNLNSTLINNGLISWSGSFINFNNGTLVNNGTVDESFDATLSSVSGTNAFTNNGTFSKSGGTGTTSIGVPFNNNGILNISTGTLTNNGAMNLNTGTVLTGSGTLLLSTTVNINADISSPSTMTVSKVSGTTAGTGLFTVNGILSWTGGTLGTPFTIATGAIANLSGASTKTINTTLINNGSLNWSGGVMNNNNGTLRNNGVINNSFDGTINNNVGINILINNGTFDKTGGSGTTTINIPVTNSGNIEGQSIINFASTFTNTGIIAPGINPAANTAILTLSTLSPLLTAGSTLNIGLLNSSGAGTGHSQLVKNSSLTLNGTLNVTEISPMPLGSYTIISLSAGTISGNFSSVHLPAGYSLLVGGNSVTITNTGALALRLLKFNGVMRGNEVQLFWQSTEEKGFIGFEIERSENKNEFHVIGTQAGLPDSVAVHEYHFIDRSQTSGEKLYRLKMLYADGRNSYSAIINLDFKTPYHVQVFPNPASNTFRLEGSSPVKKIQILDIGGRVIKEFPKSANNQYTIADLSAGIYFLKMIGDHSVSSVQLIKR